MNVKNRVVHHDKIEAAHFKLKLVDGTTYITPEKQLAEFMTKNHIQKENIIYINRDGNYLVLIYEKVEVKYIDKSTNN